MLPDFESDFKSRRSQLAKFIPMAFMLWSFDVLLELNKAAAQGRRMISNRYEFFHS